MANSAFSPVSDSELTITMEHTTPNINAEEFEAVQRHLAEHPSSPLFAKLAEFYLQDGMPASALQTAEAGLNEYEDHAGALLVAAKASMLVRRYNDVRKYLGRLLDVAPGSAVAATMLRELKSVELRFPPSSSLPESDTAPVTGDMKLSGRQRKRWSWEDHIIGGAAVFNHDAVSNSYAETDQATVPDCEDQPPTDDIDLELLAAKLEGARIPPVLEDAPPVATNEGYIDTGLASFKSRPVTETLAQIYAQQGQYAEAIAAYRELRERHPERTYEFTLRMIELERHSDTRSESSQQ